MWINKDLKDFLQSRNLEDLQEDEVSKIVSNCSNLKPLSFNWLLDMHLLQQKYY
jgi:hypothetical protein